MAREVPVIDNLSDVPRGERYAYHTTRTRNKDAILRNGIQPQYRGPQGSDVDAFLQEHRDEADSAPPHRSDCVFLYADADRGLNPAVEADEVCFVVSLPDISQPIYTADYDAVTELYMCSLGSEEAIEYACAYWDSCRPFSFGDRSAGELLVVGGVSPAAITGVFTGSGNPP